MNYFNAYLSKLRQTSSFLLVLFSATFADAQVFSEASVTPPARYGMALDGVPLATLQLNNYGACQAECKRVQGCTGFNFSTIGPGVVPLEGGPRSPGKGIPPPSPNCTLFQGELNDRKVNQIVSCRMPCTVATSGMLGRPPTQGRPVDILRDPNNSSASVIGKEGSTNSGAAGAATMRVPPTGQLAGGSTGVLTPGKLVTPPPVPPTNAQPSTNSQPPAPPPTNPPSSGSTSGGTGAPTSTGQSTQPPALPVRAGIIGYEVVFGAPVIIAPLSSADVFAQCPSGKVAISAGYDFTVGQGGGSNDLLFGYEIRGAKPTNNLVKVIARNANVFVAGSVRAVAVCITPIPGMRTIEFFTLQNSPNEAVNATNSQACNATERLIGGGVSGMIELMMNANGPQQSPSAWQVKQASNSPFSGGAFRSGLASVAICAPEHLVDGWEYVESAPVFLGARVMSNAFVACAANKVMVTAGVMQQSNSQDIDMIANSLKPASTGSFNWVAQIQNRNTLGLSGSVQAKVSGICVRRQ
jgi:hypothetical protein